MGLVGAMAPGNQADAKAKVAPQSGEDQVVALVWAVADPQLPVVSQPNGLEHQKHRAACPSATMVQEATQVAAPATAVVAVAGRMETAKTVKVLAKPATVATDALSEWAVERIPWVPVVAVEQESLGQAYSSQDWAVVEAVVMDKPAKTTD